MTMTDNLLLQQTAAARASSACNRGGKTSGGQDAKGGKTDFRDLLEKKSGSQPLENQNIREAAGTKESGKAAVAADQEGNTVLQELAAALIAQPVVISQDVVSAVSPEEIQIPAVLAQTAEANQGAAVQDSLPKGQTNLQSQDGLLLEQNPEKIPAEGITPIVETGKSMQDSISFQLNSTGKNTGISVQQGEEDGKELGEEKFVSVELEQASQPLFSNTESIPVKVGENAPLDTESPEFGENLAGQLTHALEQGEQKLTLRLSPGSLGSVTVEMTRAGDGSLHVILHAATEKASSLLTDHAAELGSLLQSGGRTPVQVEVYRQEEGHGFQQQDQNAQSGGNGQSSRQQRERRYPAQEGQDFVQRLRLGLIVQDGEAV